MPLIKSHNISDELILSKISIDKTRNQGFKLLMEKYQEVLYRQIRRMVGTHENTDDVLQNTFIKVYRHIHNFKGDSKLYSWLYRIAANEAITFLNKEKNKRKVALSQEQYELEAPSYFDEEKGKLLLAEAIETLPDKQRLVFNRRYYDELSYMELSRELATSVGALKASFHHALKKIEAYIKDKAE